MKDSLPNMDEVVRQKRKAEIAAMPRKELNGHAYLLEQEQNEYAEQVRILIEEREQLKQRNVELASRSFMKLGEAMREHATEIARMKAANEELAKQNRIFHQDTINMCDKLQAAEVKVAEQDKEIQRLNDVLEQIEHDTDDEHTVIYARNNRTQS